MNILNTLSVQLQSVKFAEIIISAMPVCAPVFARHMVACKWRKCLPRLDGIMWLYKCN